MKQEILDWIDHEIARLEKEIAGQEVEEGQGNIPEVLKKAFAQTK